MRLDIGIFCDFLHSVLLLNVILGLDFLGLALSRPQARSGGVAPLITPTVWRETGEHHALTIQCLWRSWRKKGRALRPLDPVVDAALEALDTSTGVASRLRIGLTLTLWGWTVWG